MKQFKLHLLTALFFGVGFTSYAQVGIGTTTPDNSAALEIQSTTQGLLPPRMTQAQRGSITSTATGLMVYCTDCSTGAGYYYFNGFSWVGIHDNLGNHTVTQTLVLGSNGISDANTETGTAGQVLSSTGTGTDWINAPSGGGNPSGTVIYFAGSTAPTGYLKADGSAVSRTTYASLFTAIGTTYGTGDGSTTFNLPDLRGEFVRGWDDGRGVDSGRTLGSSQSDAFQGHSHNIYQSSGGGPASNTWQVPGANIYSQGNYAHDAHNFIAREPISDGTNGTPRIATETRPRNIALLACIKF